MARGRALNAIAEWEDRDRDDIDFLQKICEGTITYILRLDELYRSCRSIPFVAVSIALRAILDPRNGTLWGGSTISFCEYWCDIISATTSILQRVGYLVHYPDPVYFVDYIYRLASYTPLEHYIRLKILKILRVALMEPSFFRYSATEMVVAALSTT
ncbi:hypothetical protein MN608_11365 [Microdochium nivale]|nr:hypothetical protein MN608_11365 [Microdochium nivale]